MSRNPLLLYLGVTFTVFTIGGCATKAEVAQPNVTEQFVEFTSGQRVELGKWQRESQVPVPGQIENPTIVEKRARLIQAWKRVLVTTEKRYFEGGTLEVQTYDYSGKPLGKSGPFVGELFVLEKVERLILGGMSAHYMVGGSTILDSDGRQVSQVQHSSEAFEFGWTQDQTVFWTYGASTISEPESERGWAEATDVEIFDFNGKKLKEFSTKEQGDKTVDVEGRTILLHLPEPRIPG